MCGIAAIFNYKFNGEVVRKEILDAIRDGMVSRGPDDAGSWISSDYTVGLAHRRLSIIDLSREGAQPMFSQDGKLKIVFNGEIYNYPQLKEELQSLGYKFSSSTDTEVLLYLYKEYGKQMVSRLRGMFAFCIWDEEKQGLFIARDAFGIKPLYYADNGYTIQIASQVKALLKGGQVDTTPEPAGHAGFLLWGSVPEPFTFYKGIKSLPPGSFLWIDKKGTKIDKQYFSMTEIINNSKPFDTVELNKEEIDRYIHSTLQDSVKHHLIADVPVGLFLSSGIDSTILATLIKEVRGSDLQTITIGFSEYKGTLNDETPLAEQLAKDLGFSHKTYWITKNDFTREVENILEAMDQPTIDGINTYFVSKMAADAGLKVAISGLGGDELLGGYPSFKQIPKMVRVLKYPSKISPFFGKVFRFLSKNIIMRYTSPKYASILEYGGSYAGAYFLRRSLFMPWEIGSIMGEEMALEGLQTLNTIGNLEKTIKGLDDDYFKISTLETKWYMQNQLLRDSDWAGMAHSIEIRVPLVDKQVFQNMVPILKSDIRPDKRYVARAILDPSHAAIVNRPKTGFSVPVHDWLLNDTQYGNERGLRGWALKVYKKFSGEL